MTHKVLIVDDEFDSCMLLQLMLAKINVQIELAHNGYEALKKAYNFEPDLVLLDVMMPDISGWEVCQRLREFCDAPIIMVTALGTEEAMVKGLNLGADAYMVKPVTQNELTARIRTITRRVYQTTAKRSDQIDKIVTYQNLVINFNKREVKLNGTRVSLTPTEYRLLALLAKHKGKVLDKDYLLTQIWGAESKNQKEYLYLYMSYLRNKLEKDPANPNLIHNVRNIGYRFG